MDLEEIQYLIQLADELLQQHQDRGLDALEKELLEGALQGKQYLELRENPQSPLHSYPLGYISKYLANNLWKRLTEVFHAIEVLKPDETLSKRKALEYLRRGSRQQRAMGAKPPLPDENDPSSCEELLYWVGRAEVIAECKERLLQDCRVLEILGITGIGKTALATRLVQESDLQAAFPETICISFERERPHFETVICHLLGELALQDEQMRRNPDRLIRTLAMQMRSRPCLLVLDMLEELLEPDDSGQLQFTDPLFACFIEQIARDPEMPSRLILTSQVALPILAEGRYWQRMHRITLAGLHETEAVELFGQWGIAPTCDNHLAYLMRIACAYKGHPLALRAIAGEMREPPYSRSIAAYWHDYGSEIEREEQQGDESEDSPPRLDRYSPNLVDLVKSRVEKTFERLLQFYPLAALLLGMGATYRVPVERQAWLSMLDEYPEEEALLAFQALQRRFLLEAQVKNETPLYRVHPLIRRVALDNLARVEERISNQ